MEKITFNVSDEQEKWLQAVRWKYRAPISRILRHILDHEMLNPDWLKSPDPPPPHQSIALTNSEGGETNA